MSAKIVTNNLRQPGRLPSLDGIRAASFFLVFISHTGFMGGRPGGFGVTVFFVLSGYLITGLLIREKEKYGSISLKKFYGRRAARIFPGMYALLLLVLILAWAGILPHDPLSAKQIFLQFIYCTNYVEWHAFYTGKVAFLPYTGHCWSLAVEEHFYLLFPFAFAWLLSRKNFTYKRAISSLVIVCLICLTWRFIAVRLIPLGEQWCYLATDTRMDCILWGCVLACIEKWEAVSQQITRKRLETTILPIAVVLLVSSFVFHAYFRMTLRFTVQSIAIMPVLYYAVHFPESIVIRPLNWSWVAYIGTLTYPLYLLHRPALAIAQQYTHSKIAFWVVGAILTWASATALHALLEKPFEKMRARLRRTELTEEQLIRQ